MGITTSLSKDLIIKYNNDPFIIIAKEFYSPAKGGSFTRTTMRNLKTGQILRKTFRTGEKFETVDVVTKSMNFLYCDDEKAYFMDSQTFEQFEVPLKIIHGGKNYLHTDIKYTALIYENEIISINIPPKIKLKIVSTTEAVKGNTATQATKEAELETGLKIQVPLFIKENNFIIINTENCSYVSKAD